MREIDLGSFAAAHADGAVVVDVREPFEYIGGHVPGAQLIPLSHLPQQVNSLPRDATVYIICASGNRSLAAADYLARFGVTALSVAGGTGAWIGSGRPVERGIDAGARR